MDTSSRSGWYRLLGVMAVAIVIFVTLMLPPELERLRTGHWFLEHFFGYFVAALIVCIGWPRPFLAPEPCLPPERRNEYGSGSSAAEGGEREPRSTA